MIPGQAILLPRQCVRKESMKKVLLMMLQNSKLDLSPARYQLLQALKDRGFETYVFLPGHLKKRSNYEFIDHIINVSGMPVKNIRRKIIDIKPQAVLASTIEDIEIVYLLPWIMKKTAFYYYNLEIYTSYIDKDIKKEDFGYYLRFKVGYPVKKMKEMLYTDKSKMFTIQDSIRCKISAKYHIQHKNTVFIPNSYAFDASKVVDMTKEGIIYSGGMRKSYFGEKFNLIKAVKTVPLTFSGEMDQWCRQRMGALKKTNPNITIVERYLEPDEFTEFLRNFAVGFVWYNALKEDEGHYHIGLSSGKMFKHLSIGQPVIAVKCSGITQVIRKYRIGEVIDDISELEAAYYKIMRNYAYYQQNILKVYKEIFDLKKTIVPLLDHIDKHVI